MIKYLFPGYVALATWTGEVYSNKVPVDLWIEWSRVGRGGIRSVILPTKGTDPGERWECELTIDRKGPRDHLLYITFFGESGMAIHRYDDPGTVFQPHAGVKVNAILGGR